MVRSPVLKSVRGAAVVAVLLGLQLSAGGPIQAAPPEAGPAAGGGAITQKEADEFGKALEAATAAGDYATVNRLIDWSEFVDRATRTPNLPELKGLRKAYRDGVLGALQTGNQFFAKFNDVIKSGGSYAFLRAEVNGKEPFVQFRLKMVNNSGLNYHRLYLIRHPDGTVAAGDMFVLLSGERMSETFSHTWLPLAAKTIREQAKGTTELDVELEIGQKIIELNSQGKHKEVLEIYKKAPESTRRNKAILLPCLLAAQNVSNDDYAAMIDTFRKFYPDNPSLDFILIDGYVLKKNYDESLACVDRTMKLMGVDAALLVTRANLLLLAGKSPQAMADIRKAIALEPDSSDPYSAGVDVALAAQDHAATLEFLTALEKKFGLEFLDLAASESFAGFVKSPQFKTWQAAHGEK
jgi:tetratricopeptide (TPR) repeat protein